MGLLVGLAFVLYAVSGLIRRRFEFHIGRTSHPLVLTGGPAVVVAMVVLIGGTLMMLGQANGLLFILGFIVAIGGFILGALLNRFAAR